MFYILSIETSTEVASVAISKEEQLISLKESTQAYSHAEQITLLIQSCLEAASLKMKDLSAVAVSSGPGSYTGLRIGLSTAKGICYALNKPLIGVSTLQALAFALCKKYPDADLFCPMIDARRMEVYCCIYDKQNMPVTQIEANIIDKNSFSTYLAANKKVVFCGNGSLKTQKYIQSPFTIFDKLQCSAAYLCPLAAQAFLQGQFENIAYYSPFYLKKPNITKPKKLV